MSSGIRNAASGAAASGSAVASPGVAAAMGVGGGVASAIYAYWLMPNRMLRDQLEPLLLINSNVALITLTPKQIHIQVIDRFITSVFQRTFWAGVDYHLSGSDPLVGAEAPPPTFSESKSSASSDAILFEGTVDIGGIHDVLSGTTPSTMVLLGHGPRRTSLRPNKEDAFLGDEEKGADEGAEEGDDDDDREEDDEDDRKTTRKDNHGGQRGRRSAGVSALANREEKVAWRFTVGAPPSLEVKVRFIVIQTAVAPKVAFFSNPATQQRPTTFEFDTPMPSSRPNGAELVVTPIAPIGVEGPQFVARTSGWERISNVGSAASVTSNIDTSPPGVKFYRFEPNGTWLNPGIGARVSMRCTSDLQDDFMNLSTFSETCEMAITNGDMQLMAKSRRSKKVYVLRYEQPYEFDATPIAPPTNVAQSKKKGGRKSATPQAPHSASVHTVACSPLPRRPVHNTPRFYVEYIHKNMLAPTIRCSFLLRSFRIIHKLIGASSRIEWIIHNNNNNIAPSVAKAAAASNAAGPVLCTFYQGTLAAERLVGVLMSLQVPARK